MPQVRLALQPETGFFAVGASLSIAEPWGHPPAAASRWIRVEMVVDTGAAGTAISEIVARRMGIAIEHLELHPVLGATGVGLRPILRGLFLKLEEPGFRPLRLGRVTILDPALDESGTGHSRRLAPERKTAAGLNILGLDVARALGARIALDFRAMEGMFSW